MSALHSIVEKVYREREWIPPGSSVPKYFSMWKRLGRSTSHSSSLISSSWSLESDNFSDVVPSIYLCNSRRLMELRKQHESTTESSCTRR